MKLWILRRIDEDNGAKWDAAFGFVVRAPDEEQARELAAQQAGDEGGDMWHVGAITSCVELDPVGSPEVVLRDFNAG